MADARQAAFNPDVPDFDPKKSYLLKGSTINRFKSLIKRNEPKVISGGGLRIAQQTQDGTWIAFDADELVLNVCIGGVSTTKTFYVKRTTGA